MLNYTRSHRVSDCPSICDSKFEMAKVLMNRCPQSEGWFPPPLSLLICGVVMGHYMNKLFPQTSPPTTLVTIWRSLPVSITMLGYRHCLILCFLPYLLASILLWGWAFFYSFSSLCLSPSALHLLIFLPPSHSIFLSCLSISLSLTLSFLPFLLSPSPYYYFGLMSFSFMQCVIIAYFILCNVQMVPNLAREKSHLDGFYILTIRKHCFFFFEFFLAV